jgi:hypothetical protein
VGAESCGQPCDERRRRRWLLGCSTIECMALLHLIDYNHDVRRVNASTREYESADWVLSDAWREALSRGGRVYLHETQSSPSFFGGTITAIREVPVEQGQLRRWAVYFTADEQGRGVLAGRDGWKRESKFVP